ncbi:hypothetical protein PgNI_10317 [Pyricularia grisea]|uniref:Fungal N-terminal domain-containing protein n=1 Tax=Pyricularia grisea TaxID=148305 RepID=A0A6P8AZX9_PYRGI|nr:hypothetical protein PgNI_10317 [Pyricularia grisea]TLD07786.1 hypothetical protein PgNI_10317 [Pyricularia grisea]
MDPVSAAGFASSIITFIDFSTKLIKTSVGEDKEHKQISNVLEEYKAIANGLREPASASDSRDGEHWVKLRELANQCTDLAVKLATLLNDLKLKQGNKAWRSLESKWKSMRKEKDIANIEQKLDSLRGQVLVWMNFVMM